MASLASFEVLLFAATALAYVFHKKAVAAMPDSTCPVTGATTHNTPSKGGSKLHNSAFVFVKPHANTAATQKLVREKLQEAGIEILSEKDIDGDTIDKKQLIDQHYYAIGE